MNKKFFAGALALLTALSIGGCAGGAGSGSSSQTTLAAEGGKEAAAPNSAGTDAAAQASNFDAGRMINVVSREDGSGTRGAFIELLGIEEKSADGTKIDKTTKEATIAKATDVMLTTVSGNPYAIGYVSLGSLNDTVKALEIDGAAAAAENIKSGTYKVARPFHIATKGEPAGLAKDFIDYIMSAEGQQIVQDSGYIKVVDEAAPYAGSKPEGKLVIAGSSSVTPVMEKLSEAYRALNASAVIEIQQSDSTAGMTAAMEGTCDIGMASRDLKDTETAELIPLAIANDGIAVIVSQDNPLNGLTSANIKDIYTGVAAKWSDVQG